MRWHQQSGKTTICLLLFLNLFLHLQAQEEKVFTWDLKEDGIAIASGAALTGIGYYFENRLNPLTLLDLEQPPPPLLFLDRPALGRYSEASAKASDVLLYSAYILPVTLFADRQARHEAIPVLVMYTETVLIINGLTWTTKALVGRARPYVYNPSLPPSLRRHIKARQSFFSGHTSNVAALSYFTAYVTDQYTDAAGLEIAAWAGAAILPAATGYLRFAAGKHYPTDVIVGYLVGAGTGLAVPMLHRVRNPNEDSALRVQFFGNSVNVRWKL